MTQTLERPGATLMPIGRYEWERLVRRIVMPAQHKLVALLLATWADPDGSRVRPGLELVAAAMGASEHTARRSVRALAGDWGLIDLVARGGGRGGKGRTAEYRLTIPTDLLDRVTLLGPDGLPDSPANIVDGQSEPPNESPSIHVDAQSEAVPVDSSESAATQMDGQTVESGSIDRPNNGVTEGLTVQISRLTGHPAWPTTTHVTKPPKATNTPTELPTQPPTAREPPNPERSSAAKCERHPAMLGGTDSRGRPRCVVCRQRTNPGRPP